MSVNSLISNAIHGSCASGCGCALCIPNTINKLEPPQLTLNDKLGVIESANDGLDEIAVADELLGNVTALEALWQSLESNTNIDASIISVAVNALQSPHTPSTKLPSMESFSNDYDTAVTVSIESIGDTITKVWEAIRNFISNIYRKVLDFFKRLFGMNTTLKNKADSNDQAIKAVEAKTTSNEDMATSFKNTVTLSASKVKYISIVLNKHATIPTDLINQVEHYRKFYNNGFKEYVKLQATTCEQALVSNKEFIKEVESEIARNTSTNNPAANALATKTRKLTEQQQAGYHTLLDIIRRKNVGSYLGGLNIDSSVTGGDVADLFDFHDITSSSTDIAKLPLHAVKELNFKSRALLVDHQSLMEGELSKIEHLTNSILSSVESLVKTLKSDYSDYPALIRTFNNNLAALQSHYNKLLSRLYRVVKHTSMLCSTLIHDVVPAMI